MSWIGGLIGSIVGAKTAVRKNKVSDDLAAASNRALPFITDTANDLKKWGTEDWDRFKDTYRPVAETLVNDANRAPDYGRYEKEVALDAGQNQKAGNEAIRRGLTQSGSGPSSGKFAAATLGLASDVAQRRGVGTALARQYADQESTDKKLSVLPLGRSDPSSSIAGLGIATKGGADYGKYSAAIGAGATEALGQAGFGIGKSIGSYKGGSKPYSSPDRDNSGSSDFVWGNKGDANYFNDQNAEFGLDAQFADGGVIEGPGTGRSDSIPAVIDGHAPARVSNGEYRISKDISNRIGHDNLYRLIENAA